MHAGTLMAALGSWLRARAARGRWLVRIEDIDPAREVSGAADRLLSTLAAFGLVPDEPVIRQSQRRKAYANALAALEAAGLAYRCACSRADLAPFGGVHPPQCPVPTGRRRAAWRMRVDREVIGFSDLACGLMRQDLARDVGDFIIMRADGWPAYQLAVVVDDAVQRITEIVRGADLLDSTPRQILLQRSLGLPTPAYVHLPLVRDRNGRKLSKQDAAFPVDPTNPLPPLAAALSRLGQAVPAALRLDAFLAEAVARFDPSLIPSSPIAATAAAPVPLNAAGGRASWRPG